MKMSEQIDIQHDEFTEWVECDHDEHGYRKEDYVCAHPNCDDAVNPLTGGPSCIDCAWLKCRICEEYSDYRSELNDDRICWECCSEADDQRAMRRSIYYDRD